MKDKENFYKQGNRINKIFCKFMKEKGVSVWEHDDANFGYGVIASHNKEKFIPIFEINAWETLGNLVDNMESMISEIKEKDGEFVYD